MKYTVKVEDRLFEVELESLYTQPVIARVDGETIEVWLENGNGAKPFGPGSNTHSSNQTTNERKPARIKTGTESIKSSSAAPLKSRNKAITAKSTQAVYAPIPGLIISVAVQSGSAVVTGQEICVLEAMKMKNSIRAPKDGIIEKVSVVDGQTVKHHDVLAEYSHE
jgi:biotin carboxyl carrier protein